MYPIRLTALTPSTPQSKQGGMKSPKKQKPKRKVRPAPVPIEATITNRDPKLSTR